MSLFQKTIVSKYLKTQKQENIHLKWESFKEHFHNSEIQNNIRNSKEEEYQEGFLRDLFVTVLGYTLKPQINHNLYRELKNVNDSKKADGGIIVNDIVTAVIELKGTDTTDLGKVESQAFGYKNNQSGCKYVITSNFEKLRFYIDNAIEFLEFNLFELTKEEFELLYLCLAYENIAADIPSKLKNESLSKEDEITKNLYKDYSVFKRELFQNLTQQNPDFNPLELFKKSQKLLDRLLFLFFGEDRGLLPVNFTRGILNDWQKLKELDAYIPLYDRFKQNFGYIDQGGKKDVFAYNGGLFKPDEILDNITIDDDLLYSHTYKLAEYDFASEVDVNILGHIFENSLNEIDEIKAQLEGQEIDKSKTKRKKDGVFYTPKYITKYIVENTVGKLCEEKKTEIGIVEEEYFTDKKRQQKTKLALLQKLENYRKWLHQITIIDPACGSGAFLNEALNFLIKEHKYIDELDSKLDKKYGTYGLEFNIKNSILENNLFGVDLNEESVEIAKLSLWLRTAEPNRKLNDLSNNIKCGNSLIDDPEIAGNKAFNWEKEFPQIFAKGGFDVVIGNPPYVLCQPSNTNEETLNFYKSFEVASYKIDLFHLFFERGTYVLRNSGKLGFITPNTYLSNKYIQKLRNFILKNTFIEEVINYNEIVFVDAGVDVATLILTKDKSKNENIKIYNSERGELKFNTTKSQNSWNEAEEQVFNLKNDFFFEFKDCIKLEEMGNTYFGIQAYDRKSSISDRKINENYISIIDGADIVRFQYSIPNKYFNYLSENIKSGGDLNVYSQDRIVISQIGQSPKVGFCEKGILTSNTIYNLFLKDSRFSLKYILAILNSQLIKSYWLSKYNDNKDLFPKIKGYQLKQLPIKEISLENQQPFIEKADQMLSLNKELQEVSAKFQRNLQREFSLEALSKKLQNWYELSFAEFLKELTKAKVNLSLSLKAKAEWEDYFLQEQQKAISIKSKIEQTDAAIDQMVYELYGLTEEEIEIVENS